MSEGKKPRVLFLGISEGTKPHVSDERVWASDYELVEKSAYDRAIAALKAMPCRSRFVNVFIHDDNCEKCRTLKELGELP